MKKLCIVLALLCLSGCAKDKATVQEKITTQEEPAASSEQQTPVSEAEYPEIPDDALFALEANCHQLVINGQGQVVLDVEDGEVYILSEDGKPAAISVQRTEGKTVDEYGWSQPEHFWVDIYDLDGNFRYTLPLYSISLFDEMLMGHNQETGSTQVYALSDGKLLYDDIFYHYVLDGAHFLNRGDWNSPGFFVDGKGEFLAEMPERYEVCGSVMERYMTIKEDGMCGLMDCGGDLFLPCEYQMINGGQNDLLYLQTIDGSWQVMEPETKEVVFEYPYEVQALYDAFAIVATGENSGAFRLVDRDGTQLTDKTFGWITVHDEDGDGENLLLDAPSGDYERRCLMRPDGSVVYTLENSGYFVLLSEDKLMISTYDDEKTEWKIVNFQTGEETKLPGGFDKYYYELYSYDGHEPGYLMCTGTNELGWYRLSLLDLNGNIVLEDMQDAVYIGHGIFQCKQGFRRGLLHMNGTWLYEESAFNGLSDS